MKNAAMQLKAQSKDLAAKNHIPAQAVLQNYMLECLLQRMVLSKYKDRFVLKGDMLLTSLVGIDTRTTMDMDTISLIRDEDEYGGFRAALTARYESINTPLKIDITTGDVLTPGAVRYTFHSSFDGKGIEVWAYNIETILAEKVETILRRGIFSTRPRDFYDVYILVKTKIDGFKPETFISALKGTAEKRSSLGRVDEWHIILETIRFDAPMRQRWERYCRDNYYARGIIFDEVVDAVERILKEVK